MEQHEEDAEVQAKHSRRNFLKSVGAVASGMVVAGVAGCAPVAPAPTAAPPTPAATVIPTAPVPPAIPPTAAPVVEAAAIPELGLTYFSMPQAAVIQAMSARIFPTDENGPGALEAGVVYFIDRQMSTPWAVGAEWYMQGPFVAGEPTQGWQFNLTPRQIYTYGIQFVEVYCNRQYTAGFAKLTPGQQDEVVKALFENRVDTFQGFTGAAFIDLVRQGTLEGLYSDPTWGGNHNMVGWKLKRYPGAQVTTDMTAKEFIELPPITLATGHIGSIRPMH
ncbi:MAG: gluconate 2-dehydrogenase subunit 3 family protein [Chloroflexales bacterium]